MKLQPHVARGTLIVRLVAPAARADARTSRRLSSFSGVARVAPAPVRVLVDRAGQIGLLLQRERIFERQQRKLGRCRRDESHRRVGDARRFSGAGRSPSAAFAARTRATAICGPSRRASAPCLVSDQAEFLPRRMSCRATSRRRRQIVRRGHCGCRSADQL